MYICVHTCKYICKCNINVFYHFQVTFYSLNDDLCSQILKAVNFNTFLFWVSHFTVKLQLNRFHKPVISVSMNSMTESLCLDD